MTTATHRLDRPEGAIAYDVAGPAGAPLVVLVPGMGDLRATWRDLVPALVDAGYRAATLDLRGHGDSDTTFRTVGDLATGTDALALVQHLGGPAVLVGSSMGAGAVTWAAAVQPAAVAGLVLSGPFVRDPAMGGPARAALKAATRLMLSRPWGARGWASYYRGTLNRGRRAPWLDEHVAAIRASLGEPGRLRAFRTLALELTHAPVEAVLGDVVAPSVVFMGARDPDFRDPAAEAAWIGERLGSTVHVVPDAGHYPHAQAPDVVVPRTLEFLAGLPRTDDGGWAVPVATRGRG